MGEVRRAHGCLATTSYISICEMEGVRMNALQQHHTLAFVREVRHAHGCLATTSNISICEREGVRMNALQQHHALAFVREVKRAHECLAITSYISIFGFTCLTAVHIATSAS